MDIPSKHVYDALDGVGVTHIYHVNSVITACQFLRRGALTNKISKSFVFSKPKSRNPDPEKKENSPIFVFLPNV